MRDLRRVVLHCTDGEWGSVESIRNLHVTEHGWIDIGYHFVITNCYPTFAALHDRKPDSSTDGVIHVGRPLGEVGAHAHGMNADSIGIALVGRGGIFTGLQLQAAVSHCAELAVRHSFPVTSIIGHYETGAQKTCPDIDMGFFRELVRRRLSP